ncbi:MAG: head GIN domain-containing protein [Maribacter sp.]
MNKQTFIIALILVAGLLTSCDHDTIRASDEVSSLDYSIPDYATLKVSNAFNTTVTFSETEESIRIEANDNLHDRIVVQREGNSLIIKLKKFTNVRGNATLNAYIVTKDISKFDLSGATKLTLENIWENTNGSIELSGASNFTGEVTIDRLNLDMGGASSLDLYGAATTLDADLSGSSDIRDFDLSVVDLKIEMSGASEASLSISESIDIRASGASSLKFKGDAAITYKRLTGASEIVKIE